MTPREIEPTRIEFIVVGDRLRSVPEDKARALAKSMDEIGLQTPITVRVVDGMVVNSKELVNALVLVAGATRLRAAQILEWEYIDCFEIEDDELHARLWEVDENLMRAELSPAEEAGHLTERKRVWQEIEKAEKEAADLSDPTWATLSGSTNSGGRGHTGFATDTAEATSKSKTSIVESLFDDADAAYLKHVDLPKDATWDQFRAHYALVGGDLDADRTCEDLASFPPVATAIAAGLEEARS